MQDIPTNPIAKIADPVKRKQVTEIMKRIKELNTIDKEVNLNTVLQDMKLPLAMHLYITANFHDLLSLNYN